MLKPVAAPVCYAEDSLSLWVPLWPQKAACQPSESELEAAAVYGATFGVD